MHEAIDPDVDHGCSDMTTMVRLLLGAGANVDQRENVYQDTPLLHCIRTFGRGGNWDPNKYWNDISPSIRRGQPIGIIQILLDFGANRSALSNDGMTPITLAKNCLYDKLIVSQVSGGSSSSSSSSEESMNILTTYENYHIRKKVLKVLNEYESLRYGKKDEDSPSPRKKRKMLK